MAVTPATVDELLQSITAGVQTIRDEGGDDESIADLRDDLDEIDTSVWAVIDRLRDERRAREAAASG